MDRITGGRFALLTDYVKDEETIKLLDAGMVEATVSQLNNNLQRQLKKLGVPGAHPFLVALANAGPMGVPTSVFTASDLPEDRLDALLKANIVAAHPNGSYTFHSRYVERFFLQHAVAVAATDAATVVAEEELS